ncbi:unnamed protein product [Amoebophrya sp. A120]|nr:unnamed protein product [Amoebophrya sp. A120]|eukprot:GSA120T00001012001.1
MSADAKDVDQDAEPAVAEQQDAEKSESGPEYEMFASPFMSQNGGAAGSKTKGMLDRVGTKLDIFDAPPPPAVGAAAAAGASSAATTSTADMNNDNLLVPAPPPPAPIASSGVHASAAPIASSERTSPSGASASSSSAAAPSAAAGINRTKTVRIDDGTGSTFQGAGNIMEDDTYGSVLAAPAEEPDLVSLSQAPADPMMKGDETGEADKPASSSTSSGGPPAATNRKGASLARKGSTADNSTGLETVPGQPTDGPAQPPTGPDHQEMLDDGDEDLLIPSGSELERMEQEQKQKAEERRRLQRQQTAFEGTGVENLKTVVSISDAPIDVPIEVADETTLRRLSATIRADEEAALQKAKEEESRKAALELKKQNERAAGKKGTKHQKQISAEDQEKRRRAIAAIHDDPAVQNLRTFLKKRHGNMVRAWYTIDKDGNGALSQSEFSEHLRRIGYPGALFTLWKKLDLDQNGRITFDTFEPKGSAMLTEFREKAEDEFGDLQRFFRSLDADNNGRIVEKEFVDGLVKKLKYGEGRARQLYQYLNVKKEEGIVLADVDPRVQKELRMGQGQVTLEMRVEMKKQEQLDLIKHVRERQEKNLLLQQSKKFSPLGAFRNFLRKKFGSIIVAWMHFDKDNSGRISFREFTRGCREVGYFLNLRQLWVQFDQDRTGFITIDFLDPDGDSKVLTAFTSAIVGIPDNNAATGVDGNQETQKEESRFPNQFANARPATAPGGMFFTGKKQQQQEETTTTSPSKQPQKYPDVFKAWKLYFVKDQSYGRLDEKTFVRLATAFPGISELLASRVFKILDYDKINFMTREKFHMLDLYHYNKTDEQLRQEQLAKAAAAGDQKLKSAQNLIHAKGQTTLEIARRKRQRAMEQQAEVVKLYNDFKAALLARFGNMVRAWQFLDKDKSGRVSYTEFAKACLDMGFRGRLKELFRYIDEDNTGMVSFQEFAPDIFEAFEEWFGYLRYVTDDERASTGFKSVFGSNVKNITRQEFLTGCSHLGYTEQAKLCDPITLFEWLDTDNGGSLNFETEIAWLEKQQVVKSFSDLQEERGQYRISGRYKLPTGNSMLWQQLKWRERRLAMSMGFEPPPHGIGQLPQNPKFFTTLVKEEKDTKEKKPKEDDDRPKTTMSRPGSAPAGLVSLRALRQEQKRREKQHEEEVRWQNQLFDRVESMTPLELKEVVDRATTLPTVSWTLDGERAVIRKTRIRPSTAIEEKAALVAREERRLARLYTTPPPVPGAAKLMGFDAVAKKTKGASILKKKLGS